MTVAYSRDACCGRGFQFLSSIFKQTQTKEVQDNTPTAAAKPGSFLFHDLPEVTSDEGMSALLNPSSSSGDEYLDSPSSSSGDDYLDGSEILEPLGVQHPADWDLEEHGTD